MSDPRGNLLKPGHLMYGSLSKMEKDGLIRFVREEESEGSMRLRRWARRSWNWR